MISHEAVRSLYFVFENSFTPTAQRLFRRFLNSTCFNETLYCHYDEFEMSTKSNTLMKQILDADREIGELFEGKTSFNAIYVKYNYV